MKAVLLAITAALAVIAGVSYFSEEPVAPRRLLSDPVVDAFNTWKGTYGKSYGTSSDEAYRLSVFRDNYNFVNDMNTKQNDMQVALNQFADMTNQEFRAQMAGTQQKTAQDNVQILSTDDVPASVDWRQQGAVTQVKNQGSCGSCWAFSTTGSMESRYKIKNGSLPLLSEQQLVDCSKAQGNQGCNGGLMDQGFTYAKSTGLETESQYPYTGRDGSCKNVSGGVKVNSFADVKKNSPSQLKAAVAQGPVSIALDGAGLAFQFYFGGIVKMFCGTSLDHGVLLVGYGTSNGTDYWIVKNSWGASWGEKGYIRIKNDNKEGGKGVCGLNQQPSYPIY